MPQAIALYALTGSMVVTAATSATAIVSSYAIGYGAMLVASAAAQSSQKRKARREYNASLEDRTVPVRSSEAPRTLVYGRTRASGPIPYVTNHGAKRELVSMVVALAGHEVYAIEDVWFDDSSAGPFTSVATNSQVTIGSKWYRGDDLALTHPLQGAFLTHTGAGMSFTINSFDAETYTFAAIDSIAAYTVNTVGATGDLITEGTSMTLTGPGVSNPDYTYSGATVTMATAVGQGMELLVTYRVSYGKSYASARPFLGSAAGETDDYLISQTSTLDAPWTAQHLGKSVARVRASFYYEETVYANGLPNLSAIVLGAKVYDPRLDSTVGGSGSHLANTPNTWGWSQNPVLIVADYLRHDLGFRVASTEINWVTVASEANICDDYIQAGASLAVTAVTKEFRALVTTSTAHKLAVGDEVKFTSVTGMTQINNNKYMVTEVTTPTTFKIAVDSAAFGTFTGGTVYLWQRRYTCDGVLSTETDRKSNLEQLLSSMMGTCYYSGGVFTIRCGYARTPIMTLDESDLADGQITIQSRVPRDELFNSVRGKFRDPANLYQTNDFKPYIGNTGGADFVAEDGGEKIYEDFEFPFTAHAVSAQRMAKMILWRGRNGLTFEANWKLSTLQLQPGDAIYVKLKRYGWDTLNAGAGKSFRVVERSFEGFKSIKLLLQEEAGIIYSWGHTDAQVLDASPNTSFAAPNFVQEVTVQVSSNAGSYYVRTDGIAVSYVDVTWPLPDALDVHLEIGYKRTVDREYKVVSAPVGATSLRIEGVSGGQYLNMYVQAVNSIGARSKIVWIPFYLVDPRLPTSGEKFSPLSANMLSNADVQYGVDLWTAYPIGAVAAYGIEKEPVYPIKGTPTNFRISAGDASSGLGRAVVAHPPAVSIDPTKRFVAYCDLIAWGADSVVRIEWLDAAGNIVGTSQGNTVAGVPVESTLARPDRIDHYQRSGVFADPVASSRQARMTVMCGGTWTAAPTKAVFGYRPFLGEVAAGVTDFPPWDAGGSNLVGTQGLARGSAWEVLESPLTQRDSGNYSNSLSVSVQSPAGAPWGGFDALVTLVADVAAQAAGGGLAVQLQGELQRKGGNLVDNPPEFSPTRILIYQPVTSGTNTYRAPVQISHRFRLPTLVRNYGEGVPFYQFIFSLRGDANTPAWAASNVYLRVEIIKR